MVSGVVYDHHGRPLRGIPVTAVQRRRAISSALPSLSNNGARTNDLGEFRIYGLEPGAYILVATPQLPYDSAISSPETAGIDAMLRNLQTRRRDGSIGAGPGIAATDVDGVSPYVPTFYPAQRSVDQASPIKIGAGQEIDGIRISLERERTVTISGTVSDVSGNAVVGAVVQLVPPDHSRSYPGLPLRRRTATTSAGGRYTIGQVVPGTYWVLARSASAPATSGGLAVAANAGRVEAATQVTVTNGALAADLKLTAPRQVRGRVTLNRKEGPPAQMKDLQGQCRLILSSGLETQVAVVQPDGTFSLPTLLTGPSQLRTAGNCTPPAWWPISAVQGTADLLDGVTELSGDAEINVTFSNNPSSVSGSIKQRGGEPLVDVFVIAYSAVEHHWTPQSRRVQAVRPANDGTFAITGLPPGPYWLAVVTDADPDDWFDPAFLNQLTSVSVKLTVLEGQITRQDLMTGR